MYSKLPFPISMENIPRQRGFFCASLKITTIITSLLAIIYALYGMAQGVVSLQTLYINKGGTNGPESLTTAIVVAQIISHIVTFLLSVLLLLGTLRSHLRMMRPWIMWLSLKVTVNVMVFIYIIALNTINSFTEPAVLLFYVAHFFKLLVQVYMLVLVSSYYRQLEEGGETERLKDQDYL